MAFSTDEGDSVASRRKAPRVEGPFYGRRVDGSSSSLHLKNLSVGGCLLDPQSKVAVGDRFKLEIELPDEGWIVLDAEALSMRRDHGIAVHFIDPSDEVRRKLHSVVRRLLSKKPSSPASKPRKG